jgi:H+-transporting ATPase
MIVMLALLNDGAILSIAYDNVHYKDQPESWNMRMVLGVSTALGVIGVVSAFGLFYLGERVFHLDRPHIQTLMYLKLSVAGHLTIFLTRTRGPFWSIRPARILLIAVFGTQVVATLIAVYGLFMTPLGWGWAGFVWGYALLWFLVNDRIKLLAYRIFDPVKKTGAKPEIKAATQSDAKGDAKSSAQPEAKTEPQTDGKAGPKPEVKMDDKARATDAKPEPKPEAKATADLTPQIAARAYELYEREGHRDGQSVLNWDKAEHEIRATQAKPGPKTDPKPAAQAGPSPEVKAQSYPEGSSKAAAPVPPPPASKIEPKPETKSEVTPGATSESKPELNAGPAVAANAPAPAEAATVPPAAGQAGLKPDLKADAKPADHAGPEPGVKVQANPDPNEKPAAEVSPQLVKKVHEFYEQLRREDVRAVEESDQAKQKTPVAETNP